MNVADAPLGRAGRTIIGIGLAYLVLGTGNLPVCAESTLVGRAVLPAETFAKGPTSGTLLGDNPINSVEAPFERGQPVQGFSAVLNNADGTLLIMSDNGFGSLENSSDYHCAFTGFAPTWKPPETGAARSRCLGSSS
jgi:glycerophosphoryl diester phosphodiesterase